MKHARAWAMTAVAAMGVGDAASAQISVTGDASLEEIVVTARKVQENLQDVPIAVTTFSAADLDRRGIREVSDLSSLAPGLNFEKDFGRRFDRPVIRGQSNILGAANAASFIDGIFVPDSLFSTELAFVERVEIIKGPQSALYGRQTFSGAISYITRKPTESFEASVRGTVAQDDEYELLGTVSGALVPDKIAVQAAATYYSFGGQYRNVAPGDSGNGRRVGSEETAGGTLSVRITPIEPLAVTLRASYAKNDDGIEAIALQRASRNNCLPAVPGGAPRYYCGKISVGPGDLGLNSGQLPGFGGISRSTTRLSAIIDYDFGGVTLTSISGYNDSFESRKWDIDNTAVNTAGGARNVNDTVDIKSFSQELRLVSTGSGPLSWIVGAYYYDEDRANARLVYIPRSFDDQGVLKTANYAAFGLVRYKLTERLSASAEVRVAREVLRLVGGTANYNFRAVYRSTNPRFTADYNVTDTILLYGSAARGNKPGGFNTDLRLPADARSYAEETSWNYEVGIKSDLFDRRLRLNVAAYKIDWKGQQLTQSILLPTTPPQTTSFIRNVGELDVKGFEVEATAAILPVWRVTGSVSYNDAVYTAGTDPDQLLYRGTLDITGLRPPNAPRWQYALGTNIEVPVSDMWRAFANVDLSYRSRKYDQVTNFAWVGGRAVTNLRLGATSDRYTVTAFARNLFDNREPVTATRWTDFAAAGLPRAFRASLPRQRQIGLTVQGNF